MAKEGHPDHCSLCRQRFEAARQADPRVSVTDYHWSVEQPPKPTQEQRERRELPTLQIVGRHKNVH